MNFRDFRVLFLHEWKSKHNAAAAAQNIYAAFGNGSVNECTIRRWYAKFETVDESLTDEGRGKADTVVDNQVVRALIEKDPGNTV